MIPHAPLHTEYAYTETPCVNTMPRSSLPLQALPAMPTLATVEHYSTKRKDSGVSNDVNFLIANIPFNPPPSKKKVSSASCSDDDLSSKAKGRSAPALAEENLDDENSLCMALGDWKPFVDKVAHFIENQKLPFEYFDIWEPTLAEKASENNKTSDDRLHEMIASNKNQPVLRHVGHGTNGDTELSSIFTMYQMKRFGESSEKYVFPPGVGLPGRVFATGEPMVDNALQSAQFRDFPRANLAKKFDIKKGLGIPINSEAGQVIVAMYATEDTPIKVDMVQAAYQEFHKYRVQLPLSTKCKAIAPVPDEIEFQMTLKEQQDDAKKIAVQILREWDLLDARGRGAILPDETEVEMANMLGEKQHQKNGLAALLLRAPRRRTRVENDLLETLKHKYKCLKEQQDEERRDEDSLVCQLMQEWDLLKAQDYSPILPDETEVELAKVLDTQHQYSSLVFLLWRAPCRRSRKVNELLDVLKQKYKALKQKDEQEAQDAEKLVSQVLEEWDTLNGRDFSATQSDETEAELAKTLDRIQQAQQPHSLTFLLERAPSRRSRTENELVEVLKHKYKTLKGKEGDGSRVALKVLQEWESFKKELAMTQVFTHHHHHHHHHADNNIAVAEETRSSTIVQADVCRSI